MSGDAIDFSKIECAGNPAGEPGRAMLERMNEEHRPLTDWGFRRVSVQAPVLDVGCGGGAALARLSEKMPFGTFCGCDISELAIESAKERNAAFCASGRMRFSLGSATKLPYCDASFATVFSVESLYFWPDAENGLKECLRVLTPGGCFMTVLEMVGGAMNARHRAIAAHLKMFCPSPDELETLLKKAGFGSVSVTFDRERNWLCGVGHKQEEAEK